MRQTILVTVGLFAVSALFGGQPGFRDDFDGAVLAPRWEWYTPSLPGDNPFYELNGGVLTIRIPTGNFDSWAGSDNMPRLRTTELLTDEDFSIETYISVVEPALADYFHTGLWVEFEDLAPVDGWFYGFYSRVGWQGNYTIRAERAGHDSPASPEDFPVPWAAPEGHFKVERVGDTYSFFYKEIEADPWEILHSASSPGVTVTHVGLFMKNWTNQIPARAEFDYFSLGDPEGKAPSAAQPADDVALLGVEYCTTLYVLEGFPLPTWELTSVTPAPTNAPAMDAAGSIRWTTAASDADKTFEFTAIATNPLGSVSVTWQVRVQEEILDEFDGPELADGLEFYTPQLGPELTFTGAGQVELYHAELGNDGLNFNTWIGVDRMPRILAPLSGCGDFLVETVLSVTDTFPAPPSAFHTGLWVEFDSPALDGLMWGPYWTFQNLRLEQIGVNMPQTEVAVSSVLELGLRILRRGDLFTLFYRDGANGDWVEHWTESIPGVVVSNVGLYSKNWGATPAAARIQFDYLRAAVPDVAGPTLADPCPGGTNVATVGDLFVKRLDYTPGTPYPTTITVAGPGQFDPATGVYSVLPTTAETVTVTVRALMTGAPEAAVSFDLVVEPPAANVEEFEVDVPTDLEPPWVLYNPALIDPPPFAIVGAPGSKAFQISVDSVADGGAVYDHWSGIDTSPQLQLHRWDYPELGGDFTIETKLRLTEFMWGEPFNPCITVGFGQFQMYYWGAYRGPGLRLERSGANNLFEAANLADTVTLRIRRECDVYHFLWKPEGGQWEYAGSDTPPAGWGPDPEFVGLILKTWTATGATATVECDYFHIFGTASRPPALEDPCPDGQNFASPDVPFTKELTYSPGFPGATMVTVTGPGAFDPLTGLYSLTPTAPGSVDVTIAAETPGFPPASVSFSICVADEPVYEDFEVDDVTELELEGWELYNPIFIDPSPFSVDAGDLILSATEGVPYDHWATVDNAPQVRIRVEDEPALAGNFVAETHMRLVEYTPGAFFHVGLALGFGEDPGDYKMVYWGAYNGTDIRAERSGVQDLVTVLNLDTGVTLRVRRECNRLYFSLKPELGEWQFARAVPIPAAWPDNQDVLWVGTIVKTYGTVGATVTAAFEYFDIIQLDECGPGGIQFRRGDANTDGTVNIADAVYILQNLFASGPPIACRDAADSNDDESVNIADAVYILQNLFASGPAIPAPGPDNCGPDPTPDETDLGCAVYDVCK